MKRKALLFLTIFTVFFLDCSGKQNNSGSERINFEISDYNLLFTKVEINGKAYTALIDFGDFAEFQLSTKLIEELGLKTEKTDILISDVNGNQYALEKGSISELKVGGITEKNITFFSAKNEIDNVSKQVGTDFQIAIGFGYFKSRNFKLDFQENTIEFLNSTTESNNFTSTVNKDYGYFIGTFKSIDNQPVNLLFDTGTPISKIDLNQYQSQLKDSTVVFQNTAFPSNLLKLKSGNETIILNMENSNLNELKPLNVIGIYGVNDMKGKIFTYNTKNNELNIKSNNNSKYK